MSKIAFSASPLTGPLSLIPAFGSHGIFSEVAATPHPSVQVTTIVIVIVIIVIIVINIVIVIVIIVIIRRRGAYIQVSITSIFYVTE